MTFGDISGEILGIVEHRIDDVHVVELSGELDVAGSERVRETITSSDGTSVWVDLAGLTFIDSSGVAALVMAKRALAEEKRQCELRNAPPVVRRIFEVTGLPDELDG